MSARASRAVGQQDGAAAVARVELDRPRQFGGALVLKSERIVYCPIQKVSGRWPGDDFGVDGGLT